MVEHPLSFTTHYPDRQVNNIYYDTHDFDSWRENIEGVPDRSKFRVRWYGSSGEIHSPILENKIKNREIGHKTFTRPESEMSKVDEITTWVRQSLSTQGDYHAVIGNSYRRSYYLSQCSQYRLTIDRNLSFWHPDNPWSGGHTHREIIVEVKFDGASLDAYSEFSAYFPFRQRKFSKFSVGLSYLHV